MEGSPGLIRSCSKTTSCTNINNTRIDVLRAIIIHFLHVVVIVCVFVYWCSTMWYMHALLVLKERHCKSWRLERHCKSQVSFHQCTLASVNCSFGHKCTDMAHPSFSNSLPLNQVHHVYGTLWYWSEVIDTSNILVYFSYDWSFAMSLLATYLLKGMHMFICSLESEHMHTCEEVSELSLWQRYSVIWVLSGLTREEDSRSREHEEQLQEIDGEGRGGDYNGGGMVSEMNKLAI